MKKKIIFLLATVLAVIGMATMVNAATYEKNATVNEVDSVMMTDFNSVASTFDWDKTDDRANSIYKVKFELKNPAYVNLTVFSTVSSESYTNLGRLSTINLISQNGTIIQLLANNLSANNKLNKQIALEKGTYYIVYNGLEHKDSYGKNAEGTVSTTIEAEYISRTGNVLGASNKTAITVSNNQKAIGIISNMYKEQYFKFTLNQKSSVNLNLSIAQTPSCFSSGVSYAIISENGVSYTEQLTKQKHLKWPNLYQAYQLGNNYATSCSTGSLTLPAGTYYLKISALKDGYVNTVEVTPSITKITTPVVKPTPKLKTPKLTKYKKNTKKIIGTATKGATIKVKVGKKSYTVKANAKGKFTVKLKAKLKKKVKITVYATKKGYKKSSIKTYKVK